MNIAQVIIDTGPYLKSVHTIKGTSYRPLNKDVKVCEYEIKNYAFGAAGNWKNTPAQRDRLTDLKDPAKVTSFCF